MSFRSLRHETSAAAVTSSAIMTSSAALALMMLTSLCAAAELFYSVDEEQKRGYVIADIVEDAGLVSVYGAEAVNSLRFALLSPPTINITVDELSGRIITSGRIDREALCGGPEITSMTSARTPDCRIRLDVAIHPVNFFRIVKIVVDIVDVNDNEPEFRPTHIVRKLLESAPTGSGFVVPTAHDADSSELGVDRYELKGADDKQYNGPFGLKITRKLDGSTEVSRCALIEAISWRVVLFVAPLCSLVYRSIHRPQAISNSIMSNVRFLGFFSNF